MTSKDIAELLFPNVKQTISDLLALFPNRKLKENAKVTRFAPSPTGYVHIGGVYQCLINNAYAKQNDGIMFLRCEDTDKKREVEGAANLIYPTLKKLGVNFDEGFISDTEESGEYGPYLQSKRNGYYLVFVKELVAKGLAYPCFCSDEDEDGSKNEQKRLHVPTGYYGRWAKCRNLSYEQIKEKLDEGKPFKIRIKSSGDGFNKIMVHDLLRGEIEFLENYVDYVLLKTDLTPVYHLAHLVDDTLMHTTTIIRDESWLPSLPLHYQLFDYAGIERKEYLHTAQVMTIDPETNVLRKISKRYDNWADSRWFLENGYPYSAVHEYIMNLINSNFEDWRKENPTLPLSAFPFEIEKMSKSGAVFDLTQLNVISKNIISKMNKDELFDYSYAYAKDYSQELKNLIESDKEYYKKVINIEREKENPCKDLTTFTDILENIWYMYDEKFFDKDRNYEFKKVNDKEEIIKIVSTYLNQYFSESDDKDLWFSKIKSMCNELGYCADGKEYKKNPEKYKGSLSDVCTCLRVAFLKKSNTPDMFEIFKVLGKEKLIKRLEVLHSL